MLISRRELGVLAAASLSAQTSQKPNIVYILADDLGAGDLACYNSASRIPTPNMNQVAKEGMRFTDMHSPSSVCTPTRYGILTGRYCWRSKLKRGVLNGESPYLPEPGRLTVPAMLKSQGYTTAAVGKWHLGFGNDPKTDYSRQLKPGPLDAGFDSFFGIPASLDMPPYIFVENDRATEQPTSSVGDIREERGIFWRGGPTGPTFRHIDVLPRLTERAVKFVNAQKAATKPFYLYLALTGPHTPWLPTTAFKGKSQAGPYGDFTVQVDDTIGQVMSALHRNGLAHNTLLIVTSDNGAHWMPNEIDKHNHRSNGNVRGQKADIYEGGHRIPFIARWPERIAPGTVSNQLGCLTDLMATAAEASGASLPHNAGEDSFSLLPAMLDRAPKTPLREAVVHHSSEGVFAIRKGAWKLALGRGSGGFTEPKRIEPKPDEPRGELYNLNDDPKESRNLYTENPEVVDSLAKLLARYQSESRSR